MKITVKNIENNLLKLEEFPSSYEQFCNDVGFCYEGVYWNTADVEKEGERFKKHAGDCTETSKFIVLVTKWGGRTGNRIRGKLFKKESEEDIAKAIKQSVDYLDTQDIKSAIETITSLKGLGISYGSKILRMISPKQAGVYDSYLNYYFCYPGNSDGYADFCQDCKILADELEKKSIRNPKRENGVWFVADIEATIFHKLR